MSNQDFNISTIIPESRGKIISLLFVDDDENLLYLAQRYLEKTGEFKVDVLTSARDALRYKKILEYDAIVSDYYMSDMDGLSFLKAIRENYGEIPFILFSVRNRGDVIIDAINNGADFYVEKSSSCEAQFAELILNIKRAVKRKEERRIIRNSEKYIADILDFLPDATFAIDKTGHVIAWNRAIEEMTGVPSKVMLGKGNYEYGIPFYGYRRPLLIDLIDESDETISQYYTQIYRNETTLTGETELSHPKGNQLSALVKVSRIFSPEGDMIGTIESIRDITELKKTERKLLESEERFRGMAERSSDLIFTLNEDMSASYVSPSVRLFLGYEPEELVGKNADFATATIFSQSGPELMQAVRQTMLGKSVDYIEIPLVRKDNSVIYVSLYAVPIIDEGKVTGAQVSMRDITERRKTESANRALMMSVVETTGFNSLRKISEIISSWLMADCVLIGEFEPDKENIRVLSIVLDGNEIPGFSFPIHGTPCEEIAKVGFSLCDDEVACIFPECEVLKGLCFQGYVGTSLRDSTGNVIGVLCAFFKKPIDTFSYVRQIFEIIAVKAAADIERSHIEENLQENRRLLAEAMDMANLVNWEYDIQNDIFIFNDRFYAMYGTTAEREGGMVMSSETYGREFIHPDDRNRVLEGLYQVINSVGSEIISQVEHRIIKRDGEIRYITVRFGITRDDEGRAIRTHGANQDITERKRAEVALRQANRQLNLLTSITRHDILNGISLILGYLDIGEMDFSDSRILNYISIMRNATNEVQKQIEFTRVYEDLGSHDPIWINLQTVISRLHLPSGIVLHADIANYFIYADSMAEKVFYNLLDNSIRHGKYVTDIGVFAEESDRDLVLIWEDNGVGIPDTYKEKIFERGFGKNTGLGMFLAREILLLTNIRIQETGVHNAGVRFEMIVPKGGWRKDNS